MHVTCPGCARKLAIPDAAIGKKVRCKRCSAEFRVSVPETVSSHAPPPEPLDTSLFHESKKAEPRQSEQTPELENNGYDWKAFLNHLPRVHSRTFQFSDPHSCLPVLVHRLEERRTYLRRFARELAALADRSDTSPKRHLHLLSNRFNQWRSDTETQIAAFLEKLPEDDPLKLAISLFGTMDCGRLERAHTKTLAWLLNPDGEHGFGASLLDSLLRFVEADTAEKVDFKSAFVVAEKRLEGNDRVDVYAEGRVRGENGSAKKCFLIIEAKIDAAEGLDQTAKYDDWVSNHLAPAPVFRVFLTPDRRAPVSARIPDAWKRLSFMDLAILFRQELTQLRAKPGYHFLRHYLTGVFKDIYRWNLPIRDARQCVDPYGFLAYVTAIANEHRPGATYETR